MSFSDEYLPPRKHTLNLFEDEEESTGTLVARAVAQSQDFHGQPQDWEITLMTGPCWHFTIAGRCPASLMLKYMKALVVGSRDIEPWSPWAPVAVELKPID